MTEKKTAEEILEKHGFNIMCHKDESIQIYKTFVEPILAAMEEYAAQQSKMPMMDSHPDTEADGYVFCGKCGKKK